MANQQSQQHGSDLPAGLSQPAQRALAGAGITNLAQLTHISEAEIKKLHGFGPKALDLLRTALASQGLSFAEPKSGTKPNTEM